ncbi:glycoside hydrolase family 28 protein [Micromonospora deserti]|uniref:Glycoside hydrolase n=1 Tax=Micromonospora deserti TaxID=2070366 RepID=A0A2W2DM48_9ACTN|nr:glycosyl hydrolase family 28 protein [Micromonospora deserti]PZG01930.1 glycoside hydrolase [Micromonospora deserti]
MSPSRPSLGHFFDVRDHGAKGDRSTLNSRAIQDAIDAAAAAGGGLVYVPPGTYLTGGLALKSHVTLHLEAGATLLGSPDLADYPAYPGPPVDCDANQRHLIYARGAENIAITGLGTIDGQGQAFWESRGRPPVPLEDQWRDVIAWNLKPVGENDRPSPMIELVECRNVRIEDVTLRNSPGWTLRPIGCDTVLIRGIVIRNPIDGPNTDGIDPTCSENVLIANCDIDTGDDAICLKSEDPYGGLRVSRNITVTNCVLSTCCNGFKIGTRTLGGFENITFSNSVIYSRQVPLNERVIAGLAIEVVDGGWIDGLVVTGLRLQNVRTPIFVRLGNRGDGRPAPSPGRLRGVMISDLHASGAILTSSISGVVDQHVEDVTLRNIRIDTDEGGQREWVDRVVPEVEADYPEARMFGRLPSYGLYCRHVTGVTVSGLTVRCTVPDRRPLLVTDDAADLNLTDIDGSGPGPDVALLDLRDTRDASIRTSRAPRGTDVFARVSGSRSERVALVGNDLTNARIPVLVTGGATADRVTTRD